MKIDPTMTARETLMLDALKEACKTISAQNDGNCILSVIEAIRMVDPQWIKKNWGPSHG